MVPPPQWVWLLQIGCDIHSQTAFVTRPWFLTSESASQPFGFDLAFALRSHRLFQLTLFYGHCPVGHAPSSGLRWASGRSRGSQFARSPPYSCKSVTKTRKGRYWLQNTTWMRVYYDVRNSFSSHEDCSIETLIICFLFFYLRVDSPLCSYLHRVHSEILFISTVPWQWQFLKRNFLTILKLIVQSHV